MRNAWILIASVAALTAAARPAAADEAAIAKTTEALLARQVSAINAGDAKAFAATFGDEGYAFLPTAADEGRGPKAIEAAARRWLASLGKVTVKLDHAHYGATGGGPGAGWFDAELIVTPGARLRITGVVHGGGDDAGPSKVAALELSVAQDDKAVLAAAAAGALPALPKLAAKNGDAWLRPSAITKFGDRIEDDAVVVGSAPSEHAVGGKAVKKLLAGWRSLVLTDLEVSQEDDGDMSYEWAVGHAEATFRVAGKPVKVTYRVLIVLAPVYAVAAESGDKPSLVAAHFSVAPR